MGILLGSGDNLGGFSEGLCTCKKWSKLAKEKKSKVPYGVCQKMF